MSVNTYRELCKIVPRNEIEEFVQTKTISLLELKQVLDIQSNYVLFKKLNISEKDITDFLKKRRISYD